MSAPTHDRAQHEKEHHDTHKGAVQAVVERLDGIADPKSGALHGRTDPTASSHTAGGALPTTDDRSHNSKVGPLETQHKVPHRRE